jgi:hypothetical protein
MHASDRTGTNPVDFRAKARLNLSIARDLSSCFGGKESDYLKRLNRKLKKEIYLSYREKKMNKKNYRPHDVKSTN